MSTRLSSASCSRIPSEDAFQVLVDLRNVRRRQAVLRIDGVLAGYFSILENDTPFEEVPGEIYTVAAKLLAKEVSFFRAGGPVAAGDSCRGIFLDLLDGTFADRTLFQQRLSGSELDITTTFFLITIDLSASANSRTAKQDLRGTLARSLPSSWSVFYAQTVVVLINTQVPYYRDPQALLPLQKFLRQEKLRGCVSDRFSDLYHIKEHYACTLRTLEVSKELGDPGTLPYYEDHKLLQILRSLPTDEIPLLCSAPVWSIYQRDYLDKSDDLKTLFAYLYFEKSLQKTADALFVHRNTVAYRIQKIKERYAIDLQNGYQLVHHDVSCLMLIASENTADPFWPKIFHRSVCPEDHV